MSAENSLQSDIVLNSYLDVPAMCRAKVEYCTQQINFIELKACARRARRTITENAIPFYDDCRIDTARFGAGQCNLVSEYASRTG